jgi:hydrogenase expression/formation protein HypC
MCLGAPGRIVDTFRNGAVRMGRVDFSGVVKDACLEYVPDAGPGEYVFVHLGYAINRLDEEEALQTIGLLREMEAAALAEADPACGA